MRVQHNVSLKKYNTFGIDVKATNFVEATSIFSLKHILDLPLSDYFLIGGGSNMLLTKDITDKLVIHVNITGIEIIKKDDNFIWITAQAGENWHNFVIWCIQRGFGGLENMSLIPGNVGTAPIQNIGAYGKELKDNFVSCTALEIATQKTKTFTKNECQFGYRNSIFKNDLKGQYIITSVTFKLTRNNHDISIAYGAIEAELAKKKITSPNIKQVSNAVITIRKSKLPDPNELGNSGSFFKNPIVSKNTFDKFITKFPEAPSYVVSDTKIKIPAGWLIDQAGFKGKRFGDAGVHKNQALVLVNYGNATGQEIWDLAMLIQNTVYEKFGIMISPEVNVY